jgi:hypothetical protein
MKLFQPIFLMGLTSVHAFGWGCEGHRMIALIASQHLTPEARTAVYRLLKENPIDPALSRFCKPLSDEPMEDSATWADDIRKSVKNDVWHYIDIPRNVDHGDFMKYCAPVKDGPGCVVTALQQELGILKDSNRSASDRATALRYVIHFVGDLHQPLHSIDDEGGNCTAVIVFDYSRPGNLHSVWDSGIIGHYLSQNKQTPEQMAAQLDQRYQSEGRKWLRGRLDFAAWLWQAHHLAVKFTYGRLSPKVPLGNAVDVPGCDAEKARTAALKIHVDEQYAAAVKSTIDEQLAKAGYRLADVLNSAF